MMHTDRVSCLLSHGLRTVKCNPSLGGLPCRILYGEEIENSSNISNFNLMKFFNKMYRKVI